jgi:7,8-dihydro-6-hydroxymethylpterin-pyrophosphokinase
VLQPLAEIAPEVRHPVLKKTIRELLGALPAGQAVEKVQKT